MGLQSPCETDFDLSPYQLLHASHYAHETERAPLALLTTPAPESTLDELPRWIRRQSSGDTRALLTQWAESDLDPADQFETWTHLFRRTVSAVPAECGESGVSLYHEFKLMSAIAHAALLNPNGLEDGFTLISGDFPGVQRIIYTITSDKAAKGVRGRSFFLQLLAECVVRRLLSDLGGLPITNALMVAGGNFVLLAPAWIDGVRAEERVAQTTARINHALLDWFSGDLVLATAAEPISHSTLLEGKAFGDAFGRLKTLEGQHKRQPLADVALTSEDGWQKVFDPHGHGGLHACAICQREPLTSWERQRADTEGRAWVCLTCQLFESLAEDLAKTPTPLLLIERAVDPDVLPDYSSALYAITGQACSVVGQIPGDKHGQSVVLQLNEIDFDPQQMDGFRLLAVHTPVVSEADRDWIAAHYKGELPEDRARWPEEGDIRDFEMLACARAIDHFRLTGKYVVPQLARLGVLRMDVDGLGTFFKDTLSDAPLTVRLAASDALSLFFDGYLGEICQQFEEQRGRLESLYLLYGGGDDLFIVGEWDQLPYLAQRIRDEFVAYAGSQFGISAGIVLIAEKFPFYRAADLADQALESAKRYELGETAGGRQKDAICFLDTVLPWKSGEPWEIVTTEHERLLDVAKTMERGAITGHIYRIYLRWRKDQPQGTAPKVYYGPYMWLAAYQMSRLANQYSKLRDEIRHFQEFLLQPDTIALSGVTARWAELERRTQDIGKQGEE